VTLYWFAFGTASHVVLPTDHRNVKSADCTSVCIAMQVIVTCTECAFVVYILLFCACYISLLYAINYCPLLLSYILL